MLSDLAAVHEVMAILKVFKHPAGSGPGPFELSNKSSRSGIAIGAVDGNC